LFERLVALPTDDRHALRSEGNLFTSKDVSVPDQLKGQPHDN
jgi:hypothetical protein